MSSARATGDHRRAWDAIPWVVNGRASAAEQQWLHEHVQACADCRLELARQRHLHSALAQEIEPVTDVDAGVRRLFKRIDENTDHRTAGGPGGVQRHRWLANSTINHWLVAAVLVEAVGLSALGVGLLWRGTPDGDYQTLSESAPAVRRAAILIVPAASLTLGELQQQLQALNLHVVSGPDAVGAYALAPLGERPDRDAQIAALRALPGMRLVEPIVAPDGQAR